VWDEIQIMMKDNNLESTFKNKAEKLQVDVRPKLWDKLEKRMDDHYETTAPAITFDWFRYAAALVLLFGAGFLLTKVNNTAPLPMAQSFIIEELSSPEDVDLKYKEMIDFSLKHYQMLANPGAKVKSSL